MFNEEFIRYLASLGVGGVIAGLMFMFYRKDMRAYIEQWRGQSQMLIEVVKENTAANTRLITVIEALHVRLDRDSRRSRTTDDD